MKIVDNFILENTTLVKYTGNDPYPQIPEGIDTIGPYAFAYCTFIEGIHIADTIKVDPTAFIGCYNLVSNEG